MKKVAYGPLALRPDEFWDLTLKELEELYEGWCWREQKRVADEAAAIACVVCSGLGQYKRVPSAQSVYERIVHGRLKGFGPKEKEEKAERKRRFVERARKQRDALEQRRNGT